MSITLNKAEGHPGPPPKTDRLKPCEHTRLRFVWRIFKGKNQPKRFGYQCLACGESGHKTRAGNFRSLWVVERNLAEYFEEDSSTAISFHDEMTANLANKKRDFYNTRQRATREEWWDWYNRYLQCDDWKAKRELVFKRDNGLCQRCGESAEEVHHVRYDNVGYEPLEDLVAVCGQCHQEIHGR